MADVRTPTDDELEELQRMSYQDAWHVAQRAQMILLAAQGRAAREIAIICAVKRDTVLKWLRRFDTDGPAGLYDDLPDRDSEAGSEP